MRALVLLHGFLGLPSAWDGLRARLPSDVAVLAPALAGHAGAPPAGSYEEEVERLGDLVLKSGLEAPHLVGYSLGGRLALGLLARWPGHFSGATLLSARLALRSQAEREARVQADEALAERLLTGGLGAFLSAWDAQPLFASQAALPEAQLRAWREARGIHAPEAVVCGLRALSLGRMPDESAALSRFEGPVAVLAGALDPKFVALAPELAAALPRSTWSIVPGAGHNLPLEAPASVASALPWSVS